MSNNTTSDQPINWDEFKARIREAIRDLLTIDVITAKGYDLGEEKANEMLEKMDEEQDSHKTTEYWIDLVRILSRPPKKIEILARTHLQLDGDSVQIIPPNKIGSLTQNTIIKLHAEAVKTALLRRENTIKAIMSIIDLADISLPDIFDKSGMLEPDSSSSLHTQTKEESFNKNASKKP